jgi:flagellar P-ring protein FlgI
MLKFNKIIFFMFIVFALSAKSPVKVKNLISIEGIRENQIMGYGLVIGLDGRGDSKSFNLTKKMFLNLTVNSGFDITENDLNSKNIAAVLVTAKIGPFSRAGDTLDVTVSSIGDSKSIEGGILLQTPLKGNDSNTYAVASGKILTGTKTQNAVTTATMPNGAIIERELISDYIINNKLRLILKYPDFVTADHIASAIAQIDTKSIVNAIDPGLVEITLSDDQIKNPVNFIAKYEALTVTPDYSAGIVIDKKTGIIVVGEDTVIQDCMVTTPSGQVNIGANSQKSKTFELKSQTVGELVKTLNDVGLNSNEIISLIESISKIGALNAKILIL